MYVQRIFDTKERKEREKEREKERKKIKEDSLLGTSHDDSRCDHVTSDEANKMAEEGCLFL